MNASAQDGRVRGQTGRRAPHLRSTSSGGVIAAAGMAWLSLVLCLALAACGSGSSTARGSSPTAAPTGGTGGTGGSPAATAQTTPGGPTATPFGSGTPNAVQGAPDACAANNGKPSASLPSTIPAYPGAQLRSGQTQGTIGSFGLCTSDSVTSVDSYYAAQLGPHGWQSVNDTSYPSLHQITAKQGTTNLSIYILPDPSQAGETEIVINYSASS